jgi:hypothetical protein
MQRDPMVDYVILCACGWPIAFLVAVLILFKTTWMQSLTTWMLFAGPVCLLWPLTFPALIMFLACITVERQFNLNH